HERSAERMQREGGDNSSLPDPDALASGHSKRSARAGRTEHVEATTAAFLEAPGHSVQTEYARNEHSVRATESDDAYKPSKPLATPKASSNRAANGVHDD